jgi:hypothetical protein
MTAPRRRCGFAAALAVCLLAAVGIIAAASSYTVLEGRRAANRAMRQEEAATAADVGLFATLGLWTVQARESMPVGSTDSSGAYVTRLTNRLYWVTAVGKAAAGTSVEARRIHNLLLETRRPSVSSRAALTSAGAVVAAPDAIIAGADAHPPGWIDCPPADSTVGPGVLVSDDPATYQALGRVTTTALADRADITLAAGAIVSPAPDLVGDCVPSGSRVNTRSWGEPARTGRAPRCERFFPVVHAVGDLLVTSGRGQGVLLVDGRLRIDGPFAFYGVVVAARGIETHGADVTIYGAVLSADPGGVVWNAPGELRRSTCAVARASDGATRPYPIPHRGWAELF